MTVLRHYTDEGTPAYLTHWKEGEGDTWEFMRLTYRSDSGFVKAWEKAVEELPTTLDEADTT